MKKDKIIKEIEHCRLAISFYKEYTHFGQIVEVGMRRKRNKIRELEKLLLN